jgi:MFS family permease
MSAVAGSVRLSRNRRFVVFCCTETISAVGNAISLVALPLLVLDTTGSVAKMGLLTAVGTAGGYIVASAASGPVVDRFDRGRLMAATAVLQAVAYLVVPVVWLIAPQVWVLFVVMPTGAVLGITFQIGYVTVLPALVADDQLTSANGILQSWLAASGIGGSAAAGLLCSFLSPAAAIGVDAVTFLVSALGILMLRLPRSADLSESLHWSDYLAGLRFLWKTPVLRAMTVLLSVQTFVTLGVTDLMIFHLRHDLHQPSPVVGYVLTVASAGSLVAGLCVGWLRRRAGFAVSWIGSSVLAGAALCPLGETRPAILVGVLAAIFVGSTTIGGTCSMSLRQQITPANLLGRVTAAFWATHYALAPVGAAVLTAAAGQYSAAAVCLAGGVVVAVSALVGFPALRGA